MELIKNDRLLEYMSYTIYPIREQNTYLRFIKPKKLPCKLRTMYLKKSNNFFIKLLFTFSEVKTNFLLKLKFLASLVWKTLFLSDLVETKRESKYFYL